VVACTRTPVPHPSTNVCAVCGRPPPEGAQACPEDGSTAFVEGGAAPIDALVGQQLGDYQVLEPIGEGGMGLVYRGVQPIIKKRVAIKVLRAEFASDPAQVKRLVSEAEAVNSISHRNIIDIFGLGQLPDGRQYIIMEYLEGQPLDAYLRTRGSLPPLEVVELLIDICGPLFAAHNAGVVHRDLKPSNVFLVQQPDGTRYLKLLDFGLAKKGVQLDGRTSQTSATQIAGTPDYMAPEQCRALDISARTDLYALGVMAWQMCVGRLPFNGPTPMDVMMRHVSEPPIPPSLFAPGIPTALDALVLALMQKDPDARPSSAESVRQQLKHIGQQLREGSSAFSTRQWTGEIKALNPAMLAQTAPPSRSPLLLAVFLALAALGGTAGWLMHRNTELLIDPPPPSKPVAEPEVPDASVEPVVAVKLPPTEEDEPTDAGLSKPPPPVSKRATREGAPSLAELTQRVRQLERSLRTRTASGAEPDPSALQLLDKQRLRLAVALSSADRKDVAKRLDSWERTFLKR
jgi:serine/threonine protein kinase